jgi:hypothetical protein
LTTLSKQIIVFAYVSNCTELWTYKVNVINLISRIFFS